MLLHVPVAHGQPEETFGRARGQFLFRDRSRASWKKAGEEWQCQRFGAVAEEGSAVRGAG